jgi:hypothetical protein
MSGLKNKTKIHLLIDAVMFLQMMAIAGIGFMIKYVLVAGFKRYDIYGRDVDLTFWGLDRHEWGSIHLYISFSFLFLLILHIVLHWDTIVCIFKKMVLNHKTRLIIVLSFLLLSILFIVGPLFIKPDLIAWQENHHRHHPGNQTMPQNNSNNTQNDFKATKTTPEKNKEKTLEMQKTHENHENLQSVEVYGYMTINEVATKFNIEAAEICKKANIPEKYANEKLGRLKKMYGFRLSDIKNIVKSSNKK